MTWRELLQLPETALWAWRKVRRSYQAADSLFDQADVAAFELNLEAELDSIRTDFAAGRWLTLPLRLVPQPKSPDKDGNPRLRQYFEVAVRDQVAWMAVATALGPELDRKMPAWSYGNRLYRAAWYEDDPADGKASQLNIGPYRHAGGHLYRRFKHSWPLYRRHISLTARRMVDDRIEPEELDRGERLALDQAEGLPFLTSQHWNRTALKGETLYAASFDLMKFYPSIRVAAVQRGFDVHVEGLRDEPELRQLLQQMLHFHVDDAGLTDEMKVAIEPAVAPGRFDGIPTGLFVGGFLANVAMLSLDLKVDATLFQRRDIAHFRFVDDHEVLAYDFDALQAWIREYSRLLHESGVGVSIEPDKYVPFDLKWLIHPEKRLDEKELGRPNETGEELTARVSKASIVNGRKPTEIMTRTLAQVSMLAATDFDLLTDAGRSQRLEQLEWLLLANIPEQEIRGDTRMAFAAARIAMLTPALFRPNEKLLAAHRSLAFLLEQKEKADRRRRAATDSETAAIAGLKDQIRDLERDERNTWQALLKRHFGLLFEAFVAHPDKVRLFIRLIDFCRTTGHDGFGRIAEWMESNRANGSKLLQCYLGAMAMQAISRHILTASTALNQADILHRERMAAKAFLENLVRAEFKSFISPSRGAEQLQRFQKDAKWAFAAALLIGALEIEEAHPDLARAIRRRAQTALGASPSLESLREVTKVPVGIWYHWFLTTTGSHRDVAPVFWPVVQLAHQVADDRDLISLRRYPATLPAAAWERLRTDPSVLASDDAGWLFDAATAQPDRFATLPVDRSPISDVVANLNAVGDRIPLDEWVHFTSTLAPNDPRRSEWTALEIIRQILAPFAEFGGPDLDEFDRLHPKSVMVDHRWRNVSERSLINGRLTWERWRRQSRRYQIKIETPGLEDYRYREVLKENDRRWEHRLRPIGQLLWGILRQSFILPTAWNIRGQERSLVGLVSRDLERLPISSFTLSILQACLLPRSLETALLPDFPSLFGNLHHLAADDTEFDRPIKTAEQLEALLKVAQDELVSNQMTVLEYEPRQLIPVRLQHLGRLDDGLGFDAEDLA